MCVIGYNGVPWGPLVSLGGSGCILRMFLDPIRLVTEILKLNQMKQTDFLKKDSSETSIEIKFSVLHKWKYSTNIEQYIFGSESTSSHFTPVRPSHVSGSVIELIPG